MVKTAQEIGTLSETGEVLFENKTLPALSEDSLNPSPIAQYKQWLQEAESLLDPRLAPNQITLSTIRPDGFPNSRILLVKEITDTSLILFTNSHSDKGQEIAQTPKVSLNIFWSHLHRVCRFVGHIKPVSEADSDAYFASRRRESQVGAWASAQSQPLENRAALEKRMREVDAQYQGKDVPRPPHWMGYEITPFEAEIWQERLYRVHDRFKYRLDSQNNWHITRLNP